MKIKFFILSMLLITFYTNAQRASGTLPNSTRVVTGDQYGGFDTMASRGDVRMHEAYKHLVNRLDKGAYVSLDDIEGSPYYNDSFLRGKILVNGKEIPGIYAMRYNAYNDQIEMEGINETEALIKAVNYSCFIKNRKYVYRTYRAKKKDEPTMGYFQVLTSETNGLLLKQERMKYKEALEAKTSMTQPIPARFIPYTNYYFLKNGTSVASLVNKKSVMDNFEPEVKDEMKKFIKSNRIDFKKESDLVKLFNYYASL